MAYTVPPSNNIQFQLKLFTPPSSTLINFELYQGGTEYNISHIENNIVSDIINEPITIKNVSHSESTLAIDILNIPLVNYNALQIETTFLNDNNTLVTSITQVEQNLIADTLVPILTFQLSKVETNSVFDSISSLATFNSSISEINEISDVLDTSKVIYLINQIESNISNDVSTIITSVSNNESIMLTDVVNTVSNLNTNKIENILASDIININTIFNINQIENNNNQSIQQSNVITSQSISELLELNDNTNEKLVINHIELITLQSNQITQTSSVINYNENLIITDVSQSIKNTITNQSEINNIIDFSNYVIKTNSEIIDNNLVTDNIDCKIIYRQFINELFNIEDTQNIINNYNVNITENFYLNSNETQIFNCDIKEHTTVNILGPSINDIVQSVWGFTPLNTDVNTAGGLLNNMFNKIKLFEHSEFGNWEIKNNQLIMYDLNNIELFRYNLYDKQNKPSMKEVFKRELAV